MLAVGGTLAFTGWKSNGWADEFREALDHDPDLPPFPSNAQIMQMMSQEEVPTRWDNEDTVKTYCKKVGFTDVEVCVEVNETRWQNVGVVETMLPWTFGLVMNKFWTKQEIERWQDRGSEAIMKYFKEKYGTGEVTWSWKALVVTAQKSPLLQSGLAS